ncbi:hypothetical protein AB0D33_05585 [Streptomyces sp. NPDC048404]|uniref:hypothetical protein n=1 Tax=unclassified Streptomyces TaxID=2593676 RepID=UPI00342D403D
MNAEEFWNLIERARGMATDPTDAEDFAEQATVLLARTPPGTSSAPSGSCGS